MANAGSIIQTHQPNRFGPLPLQTWKAPVTVPAASTSVTVTSPHKMSGTVVGVWIDPTTLTAAANIKVYDATDEMTAPTYAANYTVPNPAVETHSALNTRARVNGTLTCAVTSATAADSFVLYVLVDPNADDNLNVAIGDVSVDIDADTILLLGAATEGSALGSGVLIQGDDGTDRQNVQLDTNGLLKATLTSGAVLSGAVATGAIASGAVASGAIATGAVASGAIASGAVASGAVASGAIASGAIASGAIASGAIVDGAHVTFGAKTDAKSTATDGTSITAMQVLKEISYMEQNPATQAYGSKVSITRPANTTAYTANDCLGAAAAAITFTAGAAAGEYLITSVELEVDVTAVPSGMAGFNLQLYNVTPPSALADNAAFDLPAGDRASYLGSIALSTPVDMGSTLYCNNDNINKQVTLASASLFAYLVTVGAFTPAGNSEVYAVTLHTIRL